MARSKSVDEEALLEAALEGLELQRKRIEEQIREVRARLGKRRTASAPSTSAAPARRRRRLSPEARKRIAAAQKKRWEAYHRKSSGRKGAATP